MMIRVYEAYAQKGAAEGAMSMYPIGDPDCHIIMAKLSEEQAMASYNKPEIWIVSGEYYK